MSSGKVLIAAPVHPVLLDGLRAAGYELLHRENITQQEAAALLADCTGVVTSTRLYIGRDLLNEAQALRWIGRMGSGMEVIDVAAAEERGIRVCASPEGNRNAVAEHALGLLLSLNKRIAWSSREVEAGKWLREENRGIELEGKTVGLVGFGNTGRAFAKILSGFDVRILAHDPYNEAPAPVGVDRVSLIQLQATSDVISFHVPIRPETYHYFSHSFLDAVKKPFTLLNTSRGDVVDSRVLETGVSSGKIIAAGLDVWEGEPLNRMESDEAARVQRLSCLSNVIITPHIAGYSYEALYKMSEMLLRKLLD